MYILQLTRQEIKRRFVEQCRPSRSGSSTNYKIHRFGFFFRGSFIRAAAPAWRKCGCDISTMYDSWARSRLFRMVEALESGPRRYGRQCALLFLVQNNWGLGGHTFLCIFTLQTSNVPSPSTFESKAVFHVTTTRSSFFMYSINVYTQVLHNGRFPRKRDTFAHNNASVLRSTTMPSEFAHTQHTKRH